jgi:thiamine biosynthesis protein ThiS
MTFKLNNNTETIDQASLSITQLLEVKKYTFKMLVVKVNDKIIKRDEYPTTMIHDGDDVLVLHLMSGG